MSNDGSRIEAAQAGVHTEHEEHGAHGHVTAHGAAHGAGHGAGHDDHGDDHGGGHGHGADPNAGVVMGEPPTPAWVMTATAIAIITIAACVWLAFRIG